MSFDLVSECGEQLDFNNSGWRYLLEFAELHGFTWPVDDAGEDRDSLTSDQAKALADAVERGIADRPLKWRSVFRGN
jgi:hypothetical protein